MSGGGVAMQAQAEGATAKQIMSKEQEASLIGSFRAVEKVMVDCIEKMEALRIGMALMGLIPRNNSELENHPLIQRIVNRAVSSATHSDREAVCTALRQLREAMPNEFEFITRGVDEFEPTVVGAPNSPMPLPGNHGSRLVKAEGPEKIATGTLAKWYRGLVGR